MLLLLLLCCDCGCFIFGGNNIPFIISSNDNNGGCGDNGVGDNGGNSNICSIFGGGGITICGVDAVEDDAVDDEKYISSFIAQIL